MNCLSGARSRPGVLYGLLLALSVSTQSLRADDPPLPAISQLKTPDGIPFAILGEKRAEPAPTLFVFASDMNGSLKNADNNKLGRLLAQHGYLSVSLDIPCHGQEARAGEKSGDLAAWKDRAVKGENFAAEFAGKVTRVLDYLVKEKYTDPERVIASGTSRGGFIAFHCAALEPRFQTVIAFAPVTHLPTLAEFAGSEKNDTVLAMSPIHVADKLAGKSIWIVIGNNDVRVGTDDCVSLFREIVRKSAGRKNPVPVELHLVATINHRLHASATPEFHQTCSPHDEAAAWLLAQPSQKK